MNQVLQAIRSTYFENQVGISIGVLTGIISSLAAMALIYLQGRLKNYIHNRRYQQSCGDYIAYKKYDEMRETPIFKLRIEANANTLIVYGSDVDTEQRIEGKIFFGRSLPNYGTGYYTHGNAWGFFQVQRKSDDTIFAHMPYQDGGSEVHQAYVFVKKSRIPSSQSASLSRQRPLLF